MTGAELGPGPILFAPYQMRIIEAALERDAAGRFRWSTVVWSCPKKCLGPETRVLTADLNWVPVGTLVIGDKLLAFDEHPTKGNPTKRCVGGTGRRYRVATVLDTGLRPMFARKLYLDNGVIITASHDHKWLVKVKGGENLKWRKTKNLKVGDHLSKFLPVWNGPDGYDDGYVAGCLDGEGHVREDCREITLGQRDNELLDEFKRIMAEHRIGINEYTQEVHVGAYAGHTIQKLSIQGGRPRSLQTLGHFRPRRLLAKILPVLDGGIGQIWRMGDVEIYRIEEVCTELVTLQTSTETYFAEGFGSHNSGKTRIAAMVAAWLAEHGGRYSEIYCLANDGKQSADRVLAAVKKSNELGKMGWHDKLTRIEVPNGSFIEAVPVDPTGEAGANPTASIWSEMWGFRLSAKERLWTEFTIPPTRHGKAIRWVESYAGYTGESPVLEQLYHEGVEEGKPHPAFPDLPVTVNERAKLFCYWDHEPRMVWQTREYYEAEAALLHPSEFQRIHRNEWVSAIGQAIPVESWDRCHDPRMAALMPQEPIVLGLDAGVSGDCTALVVASRHPLVHDMAAIRAVEVWEPPAGGQMDYSTTIEASVRRWCATHNVVCVVYDPYQLHKMSVDLRRAGLGWFEEFSQGQQRAVADKQMVDLVIARKVAHNGDLTLRQHVINAAAKTGTDEKSLRFVKRSDRLKIDALVAGSMAVYQVLRLNL